MFVSCYRQLAAGLQIYNTSLEVLGLTSLKRVENGRIIITMNKRLCYGDDIEWSTVTNNPTSVVAKNNANKELCGKCKE